MRLLLNALYLSPLALLLCSCASNQNFNPHLKNSQNAYAYVIPNTANTPLISSHVQLRIYQQFLNHYYSPWTGQNALFTHDDIKTATLEDIKHYSQNPGWAPNQHMHSQAWVNEIIDNMQMSDFPNDLQNAITIQATNERAMATDIPSFSTLNDPGQSYPFDNFQNSYLPANLPVKILKQSKDHAWYLIVTNSSYGWVKAGDIAIVTHKFINKWQSNKGYIAFKNDNYSIIDELGIYRFKSRMGAIYPIRSINNNYYVINIAVKDIHNEAVIMPVKIAKSEAYLLPLPVTTNNIAMVADQFIALPYGWGGMYGYRDCSATLKNLFAYFGIWLPRNSTQQAEFGGREINLENLSNLEKEKIIREQATPFLTLIHLQGHIMLYLGVSNNRIYVFHDMWGLRTFRLFKKEGRAVVGKTVITPLDFGSQYLNVKSSLLSKVIGMTIIS